MQIHELPSSTASSSETKQQQQQQQQKQQDDQIVDMTAILTAPMVKPLFSDTLKLSALKTNISRCSTW